MSEVDEWASVPIISEKVHFARINDLALGLSQEHPFDVAYIEIGLGLMTKCAESQR